MSAETDAIDHWLLHGDGPDADNYPDEPDDEYLIICPLCSYEIGLMPDVCDEQDIYCPGCQRESKCNDLLSVDLRPDQEASSYMVHSPR